MKNDHFISKLANWAQVKPDSKAIFYVDSKSDKGKRNWKSITWIEYQEDVFQVANGLIELGFMPHDCASIVGRNRPEWLISQMGIMAAAGISSSIFTTNSSKEVSYIINHSDARFVFAEDETQYNKIKAELKNMPKLEKIILFDHFENADPKISLSLNDLKTLGKSNDRDELNKRVKNIKGDDTAFYIYTSGTTGESKAVITTNDGLNYMGKAVVERFPLKNPRIISYLPLSHIAEQLVTNIIHLELGGEVHTCTDINLLKDYLVDVAPNILLGVPRVWEKIETALSLKFDSLSFLQNRLLKLSRAVELVHFKQGSKKGKYLDSWPRTLVNKIILSKLRNKMGLKNLVYSLTGSAPIAPQTQEFFASLGMPLLEVYGLSESLGLSLSSLPNASKPGSIGYPLEHVEVKIANDGELLIKSPGTTPGYYKDAKASSEIYSGEWLHSGDLGSKNTDGSFNITGRKKEIIITAGGKNVSPNKIENYFKAISFISQAVVIGDKKPYLIALITLEESCLKDIYPKFNGSYDCRELNHFISEIIEKDVNSLLPKDETIKKFKILPTQFSVESGDMTPTQKIKRRVVSTKFEGIINSFYN